MSKLLDTVNQNVVRRAVSRNVGCTLGCGLPSLLSVSGW